MVYWRDVLVIPFSCSLYGNFATQNRLGQKILFADAPATAINSTEWKSEMRGKEQLDVRNKALKLCVFI